MAFNSKAWAAALLHFRAGHTAAWFLLQLRSESWVDPACENLDYNTEVAHYVDAFSQILEDPRIDPNRIYVYGSSLGSTTAPLVARQLQDKGFADLKTIASGNKGRQPALVFLQCI